MDISNYNKYILIIAKCGSLTAAAKEIGISQPALSSGLNSVEERIGFKIFDRKQKPLCPTVEGEIYIDYIKKLNLLTDDYKRKIDEISGNSKIKISIGGSIAYTQSVIADAISILLKRHPDAEVLVRTDALPDLFNDMKNGKLDCLISASCDVPDGFEALEVEKEHLFVCIPKEWEIVKDLDNLTPEVVMKELQSYPYIALAEELPLQKKIDMFFRDNHLNMKSVIRVDQVVTGVSLASKGCGFCIASDECLGNKEQYNNIVKYLFPSAECDRYLYLVYDGRRYKTEGLNNIIQILSDREV